MLGATEGQPLQALQFQVRERSFRRGDVLMQERTRPESVLVIKVGAVFGQRTGLDGEVRPVGLWGRGAVFGLCGYAGERSQVSAVAASAGRVCAIPLDALLAESRRNPTLDGQLTAALAGCFSGLAAWSETLRLQGVGRQLAYALLLLSRMQHSTVIELPDQKSLGALLGASRESIARAMTVLEQVGAVRRLDRRVCEVMHAEVLRQLAPATEH